MPPEHEQNGASVDIEANRRARKYSQRELAGRVLWSLLYPLFRFSPRLLWPWRNAMLRLFGASVGKKVRIFPTADIIIPWNLTIGDYATIGDKVILYALGPISIGARATVSQGAHLCAGTHSYADPSFPLIKLPITLGEGAWICADAFVGPDVTVGEYAIVGARGVAIRNVAPWTIVAGNPARLVKERPKPDRRS
jgi:putative colanic acid biosynthesis acetyltransferase WcaF